MTETPEKALERLLLELFDADEFRTFLRGLEGGDRLVRSLAGKATSDETLFSEAVHALNRQGEIDEAFFSALIEERPKKAGRVQEVAQVWRAARKGTTTGQEIRHAEGVGQSAPVANSQPPTARGGEPCLSIELEREAVHLGDHNSINFRFLLWNIRPMKLNNVSVAVVGHSDNPAGKLMTPGEAQGRGLDIDIRSRANQPQSALLSVMLTGQGASTASIPSKSQSPHVVLLNGVHPFCLPRQTRWWAAAVHVTYEGGEEWYQLLIWMPADPRKANLQGWILPCNGRRPIVAVHEGKIADPVQLSTVGFEPAADWFELRPSLDGLEAAWTVGEAHPSAQHRESAAGAAVSAAGVFISYSHDSPTHEQAVLDLANRLRANGIDAWLDRYEPNPSQGWPRWMQEQVEKARYILLVCTETYQRRFEGREDAGKCKGATWEGLLATQVLYDANTFNGKLIPVLLDGGTDAHIPLALKAYTHYRVPAGYDDLYRHLTGQPAVVPPPLGKVRAMPTASRLPPLATQYVASAGLPETEENQMSVQETRSGKRYRRAGGPDFLGCDMHLQIMRPEGLSTIGGRPDWKLIGRWLDAPLRPGRIEGSFEYEIRGLLMPTSAGFTVALEVYTNEWWPQFSRAPVHQNGTFAGPIWLDKGYPPAQLRFTVKDEDGDVVKAFEASL